MFGHKNHEDERHISRLERQLESAIEVGRRRYSDLRKRERDLERALMEAEGQIGYLIESNREAFRRLDTLRDQHNGLIDHLDAGNLDTLMRDYTEFLEALPVEEDEQETPSWQDLIREVDEFVASLRKEIDADEPLPTQYPSQAVTYRAPRDGVRGSSYQQEFKAQTQAPAGDERGRGTGSDASASGDGSPDLDRAVNEGFPGVWSLQRNLNTGY